MEIERYEFNKSTVDFTAFFGNALPDMAVVCRDYAKTVALLCEKGLTLSSAESCTGGYIGKLITDVSGSSAVYNGGVISYVHEVKKGLLGVKDETIEKYTEVSFEAAAEMAEGVRDLTKSDVAVSTTGFAGPLGGNENDPVGCVYIGISTPEKVVVIRALLERKDFDREKVRLGAAHIAVRVLCEMLTKNNKKTEFKHKSAKSLKKIQIKT